jgi:uncharacterized membrane protein YfcA
VHIAEIATTFSSGVSHLTLGNVERRIVLPLTIFGILGGTAGAYCLVRLSVSGMPVRSYFSGILVVMGALMVYRFAFRTPAAQEGYRRSLPPAAASLLGFAAAFVDAVGGGGWGPITTTTLMAGNVEPRKAVGSVNLAEFFVKTSIALVFILLVGIRGLSGWIIIALAAGAVVVTPLGAYLCRRLPRRTIGIGVGVLLILMNLYSLLKR